MNSGQCSGRHQAEVGRFTRRDHRGGHKHGAGGKRRCLSKAESPSEDVNSEA